MEDQNIEQEKDRKPKTTTIEIEYPHLTNLLTHSLNQPFNRSHQKISREWLSLILLIILNSNEKTVR